MRFSISVLCFVSQVLGQLPAYTGPYGVGLIDVEVPGNGATFSNYTLKGTDQRAFYLETVLTSIYYPTAKDYANASQAPHPWLPRPLEVIAEGFAKAGGFGDPSVILAGLQVLGGNVTIPAQVDAPLSPDGGAFPVIVFSHGDTSLSTWYSIFCGELASRGNVVVAIQHRDGTSAGTVIRPKDGQERNLTYLRPEDVEPVPSELNLTMVKRTFRQGEVHEVVQMIEAINDGGGGGTYRSNSRNEGRDLANWKGRLDLTHLVASGHSFGATSTMDSLGGELTLVDSFTASIVFDPGKLSGPLNRNVSVPLLVADSLEWSLIPALLDGQNHFDLVKRIAEDSLQKTNGSWFMTNLGTAHVSVSDAPILAGDLITAFDSGAGNATIDPQVALQRYIDVSANFLQFLKDGSRNGILASEVTHPFFVNESGRDWVVHVAP
ncbi:hypothetical protein P152DRAFT_390174 [Eremomyces bilateralis CBS 781.70]|uniref:Putative phospholipase n=1 Tax=Eremomyces bilateralis CBS 781.70 TaxID=1392243 RepID=A0A6G1GC03_9PEZI|nr:uncharacterized protein P152DRAFT_390174 [Eremomyces bilateralis CBS 781.70]KAF1815466.1 hypothetical protein P152DRAFT_390174 [Eremomyces bilateralis CBS 781.70]